MTEKPKSAGVIGWPVGHSLSPLIHRHWAEREGVDAVYLPILVEPGIDNLKRAVEALRSAGFAGVNVTLPHKEDALNIADAASPSARDIGAANMLAFRSGGIHADNSDAHGFASAIAPLLPGREEIRALILGGGGAARAVAFALRRIPAASGRPARFSVANRTEARAAHIARDFGGEVLAWDKLSATLTDVNLVVNATSLGMRGMPPLDIDIKGLPPDAVVADIVYAPLETELLRTARARGLRIMDGLEMLMRQAVPAYESWIGKHAPVDAALRDTLVAALAEQGK